MKLKYLKNKYILTFSVIFIAAILAVSYLNVKNHQNTNSITSEVSILFLGDFMIGDSYSGTASKPFQNLSLLFENKNFRTVPTYRM